MADTFEADWAQARAQGVWLFGAGGFARDVAQALQGQGVVVQGFVTSAAPAADTVQGLPVRALAAVDPSTAPLWMGVFNREAHSDYAALAQRIGQAHPGWRIVWPQAFFAPLAPALGFRFWLHPLAELRTAAAERHAARAALDDDASRAAFDALTAFRTQPQAFMQPPLPHPGVQYLPPWLREHLLRRSPQGLRLVDGGAYRGETVRELAALLPLSQVWTFEPDPDNHRALQTALAGTPWPVTALQAGLSDRQGEARFAVGQGEASRFGDDTSAGVPVAITTLDDALGGSTVDLIKLDVEGHELAALQGARQTLLRHRPVLAVAAYHRWDDLWRLPEYLRSLGLDYRLRLGLHGHNSFDTVLYAF